jgi:hypothetical protein
VQPVTPEEYAVIVKLAEKPAPSGDGPRAKPKKRR